MSPSNTNHASKGMSHVKTRAPSLLKFRHFNSKVSGRVLCMAIQCHEKFLMRKVSVYTLLETCFEDLGVFIVLRAEKWIHVRLDEVTEHHAQG